MWHFYLLHSKQAVTPELDWTDYVELLPVKDEKTCQRLEQRILKEDLNSSQIRRLVRGRLRLRGIIKDGVYLNQKLIDEGRAVRMGGG